MSDKLPNQPYAWHEYGNYVGGLAVLAAIVSVVYALTRSAGPGVWLGRTLALSTILVLSVAVGEFSTLSPAALLRSLPFLEFFRLPSRNTIAFVLLATMTTAWAARDLESRFQASQVMRWVIILVCGIAILHIAIVNRRHFYGVFSQPAIDMRFALMSRPPAPVADAVTNGKTASSPMLRAMFGGTHVFHCYEPLQLRRTANPHRPIVYAGGTDRPVHMTRFSPNRIEFAVPAGAAPVRVFMNQNHTDGWTSTLGPVGFDRSEQKTMVTAPAGRFAFVFVPPGLWWGVLTFVLALGATPFVWRRTLAAEHIEPEETFGSEREAHRGSRRARSGSPRQSSSP